jgi:hypothetical protein
MKRSIRQNTGSWLAATDGSIPSPMSALHNLGL